MKSLKSHAPKLAIALLAAFLVQAPAMAKGGAKGAAAGTSVVATVNGAAIPESRVDLLVAQQVAKGVADSPQLREQVKNFLIGRELLAQAAKAKGLEKSPEVVAELEMSRQQIMIGAYLQQFLKSHPISEATVKAEYDRLVTANPQKEYKARHILVEKESEAKDIIAKLDKGEKFENLAVLSKDPGSKDKGGELGWNSPATFVPEFSTAMAALNKGSYTTTPVHSQFGYHVIQLEDVRDAKVPSLDEVKAQIQQILVSRSVEQHVAELRQKAKIQ
jgi:peptidyl-prolyl cis-trans isomerase C